MAKSYELVNEIQTLGPQVWQIKYLAAPFNVGAQFRQPGETCLIRQDYGVLPLPLNEVEALPAPFIPDILSIDQAHQPSTFQILERDETSHSYIDMPNTSLHFLALQAISGAARTALVVGSSINVRNPIIMQRFETTSTHPYGHHSTYRLLNTTQIAEALDTSRTGHAQPSTASLAVDCSEEQLVVVVVVSKSTTEALAVEASITDTKDINAFTIPSNEHPGPWEVALAAACGRMEGLEDISIAVRPVQDLVGIGAQFQGYVDWEGAKLA